LKFYFFDLTSLSTQAFSAFTSSAVNNFGTAFGCHARLKSMSFVALSLITFT
jgi:hypothetical protein